MSGLKDSIPSFMETSRPSIDAEEPDYDGIIDRFRKERHRLQTWRAHVEAAIGYDEIISELKPIILKGRLKDETSLCDKVLRKHDPPNRAITPENLLLEIEDLVGVRLVLAQKNHVPVAIDRIRALPLIRVADEIHYVWHPEEVSRLEKEGVNAETKESGYCSRHLILCPTNSNIELDEYVNCEVQVRTLLEEAIFENDHRIRYKRKHGLRTAQTLTRLAQLLETADLWLADAYTFAEEEAALGSK